MTPFEIAGLVTGIGLVIINITLVTVLIRRAREDRRTRANIAAALRRPMLKPFIYSTPRVVIPVDEPQRGHLSVVRNVEREY